ncbi:MAG: hypothetical protein NTY35_08940 [Planctomycetota bacterium]|nr:hypothetical protein [Planctomycetota bacterium]
MNHLKIPTLAILSMTALMVPSSAQTAGMAQQVPPELAQGKFSNVAVGISLAESNQADQWLIRSPGVNGGVPVAWSTGTFGLATPNHPDFSVGALTAQWPSPPTPPKFGGISTGGEVMPVVSATGKMVMTTGNWYMLSISVGRQAQGIAGSLLRSRTFNSAGPRSPAGDILSYYAVGSTGINPALVDTVRLEYSREQLQLQQPSPATSVMREVANHDFGLGVISIDPDNRAGSMFPVRDRFYFTLTKEWVNQVGSSYSLASQTVNASTIYEMTWNGSQWSAPTVAFSHAMLFPNRAIGSVEIDALSVDRGGAGVSSPPDRTVFSLTPASDDSVLGTYDQILVYQRGNTSIPQCNTTALLAADSPTVATPVREKFGLIARTNFTGTGEPDNVTSTCGGDPKEPYQVGSVVGVATGDTPCGSGRLGLSVLRTAVPPGGVADDNDNPYGTGPVHTLHLQVSGLDFAPYTWGFIVFYIEGPPGTTTAPVQWGAPYWIDPSASQRNTLDVAVAMPSALLNVPLRLSARCVGVNITAPQVGVDLRSSWVISILL